MKNPSPSPIKRGFTLVELMVAMAITTIMVTVLITITSLSLDTWNRSRGEIRAARQAQSMVEIMARDFQGMVTRSGNNHEWLFAKVGDSVGSGSLTSPNSAELIFFTAATDRYNGDLSAADSKGDISAVGYALKYIDPIRTSGGGNQPFETFVLYRQLVNPDVAFDDLLGKENLETAFAPHRATLDEIQNFVCENIYQFTVTFHIKTQDQPNLKLVTLRQGGTQNSLYLSGQGIKYSSRANDALNESIVAVEISLTVLSDTGINTLRNNASVSEEFLKKHSFEFTKRIEVPQP